MERPFEILQLINGNFTATNGRITVGSDVPCVMRMRRGVSQGLGNRAEMLYAELPGGVRVYVREFPDNTIAVQISNREIYF